MRLPIDTSSMRFISAGSAQPVLDFETRIQRVDELGRPLFNVSLFSVSDAGPATLTVRVASDPKGLGEFTPIKLTGLVATVWGMGDRHGVSFKADQIETASKASA
jgi:hypothetical protein